LSNGSSHFDAYRSIPEFAPRLPDLSRQEYSDETDDLSGDPQVTSFQVAPDDAVQFSSVSPKYTDDEDGEWLNRDKANLYLWLIRTDDVMICLELGELGKATLRNRLSHTNLSGNALAHCGGELWFKDAVSVYVNGGSSRFTPRNSAELAAVAEGIRSAGYRVCCFGWNEDRGAPKRTLRKGEIEWL
jgi:hypothetical protein